MGLYGYPFDDYGYYAYPTATRGYGSFGYGSFGFGYPGYGVFGLRLFGPTYPAFYAAHVRMAASASRATTATRKYSRTGITWAMVDDFDGVFQRLNLEAGPHRIEVRTPNRPPISFDVRVDPGQTIMYRADSHR